MALISYPIYCNNRIVDTVDEIIPNLYLSGRWCLVYNLSLLKQLGITHILSITEFTHPMKEEVDNFTVKHLHLDDDIFTNITEHMLDNYKFINSCIENNGKILIHCQAGVSRSASVVIMYLMVKKKISFTDAYNFVKQKRNIINPNISFIQQMEKFLKK